MLNKSEIAELLGASDSELIALNNLAVIGAKTLKVGDDGRADAITEIVHGELKAREIESDGDRVL